MNLTMNETKALFYLSSDQSHFINTPALKRALKSGSKKLEQNMYELRRKELFDTGAQAAKSDLMFKNKSLPPKELGCLEQGRWYDGYCSVDTTRKNPYWS
jgi:hypothetical protein